MIRCCDREFGGAAEALSDHEAKKPRRQEGKKDGVKLLSLRCLGTTFRYVSPAAIAPTRLRLVSAWPVTNGCSFAGILERGECKEAHPIWCTHFARCCFHAALSCAWGARKHVLTHASWPMCCLVFSNGNGPSRYPSAQAAR